MRTRPWRVSRWPSRSSRRAPSRRGPEAFAGIGRRPTTCNSPPRPARHPPGSRCPAPRRSHRMAAASRLRGSPRCRPPWMPPSPPRYVSTAACMPPATARCRRASARSAGQSSRALSNSGRIRPQWHRAAGMMPAAPACASQVLHRPTRCLQTAGTPARARPGTWARCRNRRTRGLRRLRARARRERSLSAALRHPAPPAR